MAGPPDHIPADELWTFITQLPRPTRHVEFPRKDPNTGEAIGQVVLQILSQQEQMAACIAAERFARDLLKEYAKKGEEGLGYDNVYNNAAAVEVLYRATLSASSFDEGEKRPFFPSPKDMREKLSPDEIGILMAAYLRFQSESGPIVSQMTEEEMEAWVKRLAEGGSAFPLYRCSSDAVTELVMRMASRLYSYWTATSSPGSPQEESTQSD